MLILFNSHLSTKKVESYYNGKIGKFSCLDKNVDEKYIVSDEAQLWKWKELKGAKKVS